MIPASTEISFQHDEVKKKTFLLILLSFLSAFIYWKIITLNLVGNEIQNGAGWPFVLGFFWEQFPVFLKKVQMA